MPYVSPVNLVNPLGGCPRPEGADADADAEVANLAASSCSAHPTPSRERRPTPMSASSMIRGLYRGTSEQESPRFKKSAVDRFCDSSNSEAPRLDSTLRRRNGMQQRHAHFSRIAFTQMSSTSPHAKPDTHIDSIYRAAPAAQQHPHRESGSGFPSCIASYLQPRVQRRERLSRIHMF